MSSHEEIRAHILAFVSASLPAVKENAHPVSDDFDLRVDGAIDSLGFLRLISELEARTGKTIELADIDPEKLTRLSVLTAHIAKQMVPLT